MRKFLLPCLTLFAVLMNFLVGGQAYSKDWRAVHIETEERVLAVAQIDKNTVLVKIGKEWKNASHWKLAQRCAEILCLSDTSSAPKVTLAPAGGMEDGGLATHSGKGFVAAWYGAPTQRYLHGVLGNTIEGGSLVARDHDGKTHTFTLPKSQVFEDLTPRLVDLDGDGNAEIITIRSFVNSGASIAVFALRQGEMKLVAETPAFGKPYRWLNVAGIADFNGDGKKDIAFVVTPHIGGTLEIWSYTGDSLVKLASSYGFSNHFSGERTLGLSAVADVTGDGVVDIAVPNSTRYALRIMQLDGNELIDVAKVGLRNAIARNIGVLPGDKGKAPIYILGVRHGKLMVVTKD